MFLYFLFKSSTNFFHSIGNLEYISGWFSRVSASRRWLFPKRLGAKRRNTWQTQRKNGGFLCVVGPYIPFMTLFIVLAILNRPRCITLLMLAISSVKKEHFSTAALHRNLAVASVSIGGGLDVAKRLLWRQRCPPYIGAMDTTLLTIRKRLLLFGRSLGLSSVQIASVQIGTGHDDKKSDLFAIFVIDYNVSLPRVCISSWKYAFIAQWINKLVKFVEQIQLARRYVVNS